MGDIDLTGLQNTNALTYTIETEKASSTLNIVISRPDVGGVIGTLKFDKNAMRALTEHLAALVEYYRSDFEFHKHHRAVYDPQTKQGHIDLID